MAEDEMSNWRIVSMDYLEIWPRIYLKLNSSYLILERTFKVCCKVNSTVSSENRPFPFHTAIC